MTPIRVVGAAALTAAAAIACGSPKTAAPDVIERALPSLGDAPRRDGSVVLEEDDLDASTAPVDGGQCCAVRFALAHVGDEQSAMWVAPPNLRVAMARDGGAWETTVCLLPDTELAYYYETTLRPEEPDAGGFVMNRINPSAPSTNGGYQDLVNLFEPNGATSCETLDAGAHGAW